MEFLSSIFANPLWMLVIGFTLPSLVYILFRRDWQDTINMLVAKVGMIERERDRISASVSESVAEALRKGRENVGILIVQIEQSAKTGRYFYSVVHPGDETTKPGATVFVSSNRHFKSQFDAVDYVRDYLDTVGLRYIIILAHGDDTMVDANDGRIESV